jgi:hypothetical protein
MRSDELAIANFPAVKAAKRTLTQSGLLHHFSSLIRACIEDDRKFARSRRLAPCGLYSLALGLAKSNFIRNYGLLIRSLNPESERIMAQPQSG